LPRLLYSKEVLLSNRSCDLLVSIDGASGMSYNRNGRTRMDEPVLETHALTKRYRSLLAVDSLSVQVPRGGVFGLLGPNGSGKTTTMSMLLGLIAPTSGTFRLLGHDTSRGHRVALRHIGALVESPAFYPTLSGRDNLMYFQGIRGGSDIKEIESLLEVVGLASRGDSRFNTYSQGMRQRLGIACALLGDPELLILDEPTNGLDPVGMAEVRELIRRLGTEGHTVLLSSHLLHEVEQVCENIAILSRGRLIAQGAIRDLLQKRGAIRLSTTDNVKAASIVSAIPWVAKVMMDNGYLVAEGPPDRSWELSVALSDQGIAIREMSPVQVSLEHYFMEVTGNDGDSAQGGT
jgi:ABC-2 type transport system ATP-binding protein